MALDGGYYHACLQNAQQAVEKYLKAGLLYQLGTFPRTHSVNMLSARLGDTGASVNLSEEECELLDTIYVPSKYPVGDALPEFCPNQEIGLQCVAIGERVRQSIRALLK